MTIPVPSGPIWRGLPELRRTKTRSSCRAVAVAFSGIAISVSIGSSGIRNPFPARLIRILPGIRSASRGTLYRLPPNHLAGVFQPFQNLL